MDTRTKANLTTEKVAMRTAVDLGSLPLDRSIKVVKGDGSRRMAVFADPDCPFCKELEQALESVDNVTIHTLLFPVDELHPGASKHARAIWCAPDRAAAWTAWMLRREAPPDATCQDDPIAEIRNLAIKLRLSGTPTVIFENGKRVNGLMTAADIEAALSDHNPVHPTVPAAASR
jgi:thiol:disulfide interchange protein DsbC